MPSNVLFCPSKSPKSKGIQFTIIYDEEKQHILSYDKLEHVNVQSFFEKWLEKIINKKKKKLFSHDLVKTITSSNLLPSF